ncbi:hypothetical protein AURDEDRAFT_182940 [Auricularia subglabra TFB-10046 SS5]|nr:hypothetical protein AURDEDRAFT_182940 [Auricularia subglabra TFB-10046 SS5]
MSQRPNPAPQHPTSATFFLASDSEPSESSSSSGSQDSVFRPAPIPARLLQRPAPAQPARGGAAYPPAVPQRPFQLPTNPPTRRGGPVAARGAAPPVPGGQSARPVRTGGGWQVGAAVHAPPGPSMFPGTMGQPASPAVAPLPPPQRGAPTTLRPAHGRPLQSHLVAVPRDEPNELCPYCGRYVPVDQLQVHMMRHRHVPGNFGR